MLTTEQTEQEARIEHLEDIRDCLIAVYGGEGFFQVDLDEIVAALDEKIKSLT